MTLTVTDLQEIKEVYGYTLVDLGALLGVSDAHINNILKGKRRFTERLINRLVTELDLTDSKLSRIKSIYHEFKR
ncbi:helix-turn-helix domain-containing protein [Fictibacillus gelatini]|uniref:helix-turn-helix domain-containing protein n=1 Tax=Fictibacillus gelatini TaxID=225985 RepID=UPI000409DD55|nr:helix-turn-helix transcriptional regulator [Fictibacillus gelatini]